MAAAFIVSPEQTMRYSQEIPAFHKKCKEKPHKIKRLARLRHGTRFWGDFRRQVTLYAFPVMKMRLAGVTCENAAPP
ncbi:hypothetical protein [Desulfovibrio piger]|uniref:hypothetical protein n=1 Tax=Desulfovibrio piger TaxID=901 RepID=UPI0026EDA17E|nr:hypothetical protein [Desulfovibrio piger]